MSTQDRQIYDSEELIDLSSKAHSVNPSQKANQQHAIKYEQKIDLTSKVKLQANVESVSEVNEPQTNTQLERSKVKLENVPAFRLDPNEMIQLGSKKQEKQAGQSKLEKKIWAGTPWQYNLPRRYKNRNQKVDFTSMRYECFCSRQYLSYCALYQHLRMHHPEFMNRNKRFSTTNTITTVDPVYGYKIKKLTSERRKLKAGEVNIPGANLCRKTKRRIRQQSPHIQKLLTQLQEIELYRENQGRTLKILQQKRQKKQEMAYFYNKMIHGYEEVLRLLKIDAINDALRVDNLPLCEQFGDGKDYEYFPE